MGIEKRAHPRFAVKLRVQLDYAGRVFEARTRDLSLGGMFVETTEAPPYGSKLVIQVDLPALESPAQLRCVVRWVIASGMGVSFGPLRAAETWAINQLATLYVE